MKEIIGKLDFIKIKNFCSMRVTWLAQSVDSATLDPGVMNSSPRLDIEILNKTKQNKTKQNKTNLLNLCSVKDNAKRMRRQATAWEKIFARDISDKELLSKIYKDLLKLNNTKKNNLMKNIGKRSEQITLQRR